MTEEEINLVGDLMWKKISKQQFLAHWPKSSVSFQKDIFELLDRAYDKRSSDEVEYLIFLGFTFNLFDSTYLPVLNKLITQNWHINHDDIAGLLLQFHDPSSLEPLYEAATKKIEYLSFDDNFELARKCIKALSVINTAEALEKLKILSKLPDAAIAGLATKELNYKSLQF